MNTLEKISQLLHQQNKKQKDLTDFLGLTKNTFTNWKLGTSESYKKYIDKIAEFFGVSTDYLLGVEEIKNTPDELQLTEGEKMLLSLFRQIPEERQQAFLEMGRLYSDSLKKD